jgi:DNA polymerase-3 subunit gamma/tau
MSESGGAYRVLARKYRPSTFAELIGQEAMVRTLANAISTGRIAHAFILTGVRGVGKTTTATAARAFAFSAGATESSRSRITASAPAAHAFSKRSGRVPGTNK